MADLTKIYYKDKSGNILTNEIPPTDVDYWKSQGWSTDQNSFGTTPTPAPSTPPAISQGGTTAPPSSSGNPWEGVPATISGQWTTEEIARQERPKYDANPSGYTYQPQTTSTPPAQQPAAQQTQTVNAQEYGENAWAVPLIQNEFKKRYGRDPNSTEIQQVISSGNIKYDSAEDWLDRAGLKGETQPAATTPATAAPVTGTQHGTQELYIGSTNWNILQQQYSPQQLEYATELIDGKRYWNPERNIADFGTSKTTAPAIVATAPRATAAAGTNAPGTSIATSVNEAAPNALQNEISDIDKKANEDQLNELKLITSQTNKVDLSKSAQLTEKLVEYLDNSSSPAQTTPSMAETFATKRQELGVGPLEDALAAKNAELARLDADYTSRIETEGARTGISILQANRRKSQADVEYNIARRDLVAERDGLVNQLNMKYGVINTMMTLAGMDYDRAQTEYQNKINNSISLVNLIRGIESDQKTEDQRKSDNARANLQIVLGLLQKGNIDYDNLDTVTKLDIKNMEIQSGLPVGFTALVSEQVKDPVVTFLPQGTDAAGNRIQPIATRKADGTIEIKNITLYSEEPASNDEKKLVLAMAQEYDDAGILPTDSLAVAQLKLKGSKIYQQKTRLAGGGDGGEDTTLKQAKSDMNAQLSTVIGPDGYISPDNWLKARNAWIRQGYNPTDFDSTFKGYKNPTNIDYIS